MSQASPLLRFPGMHVRHPLPPLPPALGSHENVDDTARATVEGRWPKSQGRARRCLQST